MQSRSEIKALLEWQIAMGADEAIAEAPVNMFLLKATPAPVRPETTKKPRLATPPPAPATTSPASTSLAETIEKAKETASAASNLTELRSAIAAFDGCSLSRTARQMVFADGTPEGQIMLIGEAPGAEEDRQGIPFCGASGQLLDKMLASIGLSRTEQCYITNTVFWRPPGNRNPTPEELAICRPFVDRHIALMQPKLLILLGGVAAKSLLDTNDSMNKMMGRSHRFRLNEADTIETRVLFHPSYLLRQPEQKKLAWAELLAIKALLQIK